MVLIDGRDLWSTYVCFKYNTRKKNPQMHLLAPGGIFFESHISFDWKNYCEES